VSVTCNVTALRYAVTLQVCIHLKAWVCGRSLAGVLGSNPAEGMDVWCKCYVLSGRGLCDELITRTEESYRLLVCVCLCVCVCVCVCVVCVCVCVWCVCVCLCVVCVCVYVCVWCVYVCVCVVCEVCVCGVCGVCMCVWWVCVVCEVCVCGVCMW
jgi:hypothetical protein